MNLKIDATQPNKVDLFLGQKTFSKPIARPQEQSVLQFIDEVLHQEGIHKSELSSLTVNPGPGSFTGCRVAVAIGNALAFALKIPINNRLPPIKVIYSAPPHITLPRPKN